MLFTALILGFTGSIHCIGMCSPLAMAVANVSKTVWLNRLFYNGGRIFIYSILGLGAASADALFPVSQYQNLISILLGITLLVMGVAGISGLKIPFITAGIAKFIALLKRTFARYLHKKNTSSVILLGMINGFLPCGLTFMALMVCVTLKGPWMGFTYMLIFGLGTLPAMLGFTAIINLIIKKFRWSVRSVMTVLMITSGSLLITRVFVHHNYHHAPSLREPVIMDCR
jgi:sulfite exporter TauE/SafE